MLDEAFGAGEEAFTDQDWEHASGGTHFVLRDGPDIVGHAAVVERELRLDGRSVCGGYIEAVAVRSDRQGRGLGSRLMAAVDRFVADGYELGALSTGRWAFYEHLGWRRWEGVTSVQTPDGEQRTPEEDGTIMVLATPSSSSFDRAGMISCDWRAGDVW